MTGISLQEMLEWAPSRRSAQVQAIQHYIGAGLSGREALDALRKLDVAQYPTGLGIRTQTFYQLWTPLRDLSDKVGRGSLVQAGQHPGIGTMAVTPFNQTRDYNYYVRVDIYDAKTDTTRKQFVTVADDVRLTVEEIEDAALDALHAADYGVREGETAGVHYSHGQYRPGAL